MTEELYDSNSNAGQPNETNVTDAQRAELDRRIEEMDCDDTLGVPWGEAISKIRGGK